MPEEEKKDQVIVVPDDERFPEKFRGKPIDDVLKSYAESEKQMHTKSEEAKAEREEREKLQEQLNNVPEIPAPEPVVEPIEDDYEFMTRAEFKKVIAEIKKEHGKELETATSQTTQKVMVEMETRAFIKDHPELFDGLDDKQTNDRIKRIAGMALTSGAKSLEGGLQALKDEASAIGLTSETKPPKDTPGDPGGVMDDEETHVIDAEIERMKNYHGKTSSRFNITK